MGSSWATTVPILATLIVIVLVPVGMIFRQSLAPNPFASDAASVSIQNYRTLFSISVYREAMWRTIWISVLVAALAVALGFVTTLALTAFRSNARSRDSTPVTLLLAPVFAGSIVLVLGWLGLLAKGGVAYSMVNAIRALLGQPEGRVIQTNIAIILGLLQFVVPFVVLIFYPLLNRLPVELYEAGLVLGDTPSKVIRRVILPLAAPGILSAGIVALSVSVAAYVTPQVLGGDRNLVLTTLITQLLASLSPTTAAAGAVVLGVVGLVTVAVYSLLVGRVQDRGLPANAP